MADSEAFKAVQYRLAAHIRDPERAAPPAGIEDRRLAIYRDLFFNNVSSLLAGTYPVLHEILGASDWQQLIRAYFVRHQSHTPYFLEISRDFLEFLQQESDLLADRPPFLLELAHYEWIELALSVAEQEPDWSGIDAHGDLIDGEPVLSPLTQVLCYRFPVHTIGPDHQPVEAPPDSTWLVVVRNQQDQVKFVQINQVTARLLELTAAGGMNGRAMLEKIAQELDHQRPEVVVAGGVDLLKMLGEKDIILGARLPSKQEK